METTNPPQYGTRGLLKTITAWAVILAVVVVGARWRLQSIRRQEAESRLFQHHGGTVSYASAMYSIRSEGQESWNWIGKMFFDYVQAVDLSGNAWPVKEQESQGQIKVPRADDEVLKQLWTFKRMKQLNLRGSNVTDAGLMHLVRLPDLEHVDISGTKVTSSGLKAFRARMPYCRIINDEAWGLERSPLAEDYWLRRKMGLSGR